MTSSWNAKNSPNTEQVMSGPGTVKTIAFVFFHDGEMKQVSTTSRRRPKERLRAYVEKKWPGRKFEMGNTFERHFWGAH
jgi:hypothetical protein